MRFRLKTEAFFDAANEDDAYRRLGQFYLDLAGNVDPELNPAAAHMEKGALVRITEAGAEDVLDEDDEPAMGGVAVRQTSPRRSSHIRRL